MTGRIYLERGRLVTVLIRWGAGLRRPRNVLIRREDGQLAVRPFRSLRKPAQPAAGPPRLPQAAGVTAAVIPLAPGPALGEAATAFLGRRRDLDPDTLRSYAQTMTRLRRELGDATPVSVLTAQAVAASASAAARTWNRHRSAIRSFTAWAASPGRGWVIADLAALLERRPETADRTRALPRPGQPRMVKTMPGIPRCRPGWRSTPDPTITDRPPRDDPSRPRPAGRPV